MNSPLENVIFVKPQEQRLAFATAIAENLGAPLTSVSDLKPSSDSAVVFFDLESGRPSNLIKTQNTIIIVPPGVDYNLLSPYSFTKAGHLIRRIIVHTPLHHMFAIERLKFPAKRVELIPPALDFSVQTASDTNRADGEMLVVRFPGWDEAAFESSGLQRRAKVTFVDSSDKEKLQSALARTGVCLIAAAKRESGAGISELQAAMASGAPIIASRTWGIQYLLADEQEGLLYEPGDASDMLSVGNQLLSEPSLAHQFGDNARAKFRGALTQKHYCERLRRILLTATAESGPEFFLIPAHGRPTRT